ncbi:FMRFamide receptor isoform X2 [Cylas formicarius]|uniref:FMRFamide receptor isoform X2 n=1 Tax=Cylas formicarius TaxID=197179 RepID=UPI0029583D38|nr:FMRFamide receptor isoform X2 [Cylas formicarius]
MKDSTEVILENSRFWFQKVLVPLMMCVGVAGNTVTVMVMTRRRMRSSTNIYLSALAIADIIYLFFVLVLSFKHYSNINDRKYELYWRFFGLSHWLCDAASSTSVWLTVSFTIERYVAVCHPMKGKHLCTENRAKTVTVVVFMFCILTTASTTFEYQLSLNDTVACKECKPEPKKPPSVTNATNVNATAATAADADVNYITMAVPDDRNLTSTLKNLLSNCTTNHPHVIYVYPKVSGRQPSNVTIVHRVPDDSLDVTAPSEYDDGSNDTANVTAKTCCAPKYFIYVESTNLGRNDNYRTFMSWYSAIFFGLFPLVLIATFNCFLIRAVYLSQKMRRQMTNNSHAQTQDSVAMSNENRITLMLIAVVGMFLICQTPTASYLIYYNLYPPVEQRQINVQTILGNVSNFLITVNASCNFLLYSIMSKRFRATFKKLFWERDRARQDTMALSSTKSRNSQKFNPLRHGIRRNASEYRTPRNLEVTIYFFNKGKYVTTYRLNVWFKQLRGPY